MGPIFAPQSQSHSSPILCSPIRLYTNPTTLPYCNILVWYIQRYDSGQVSEPLMSRLYPGQVGMSRMECCDRPPVIRVMRHYLVADINQAARVTFLSRCLWLINDPDPISLWNIKPHGYNGTECRILHLRVRREICQESIFVNFWNGWWLKIAGFYGRIW